MVTLDRAQHVAQAALAKAAEQGVPSVAAVVDAGGHLVALARDDGAWRGSVDIATNKAFTSAMFTNRTEDVGAYAQPGQPLFGLHATNGGRIILFAGGIPLREGDEVVGAVGVSGGTPDQDGASADAAAAAWEQLAAPVTE